MSDENTPEGVAFKLFKEVAYVEGKDTSLTNGSDKVNRKWVLDTYAECMLAVSSPQARFSKSES